MATLTLKNVPDELLRRLKDEARSNRRSLNQETLARLERSLAVRERDPDGSVDRLHRLHRRLAHLPRLTDEWLDAAKRASRP